MSAPQHKEAAGLVLLGLVLLAVVALLALELAGDPELQRPYRRDPGPALQPRLMLILLGGGAALLVGRGVVQLARAGWRLPWSRADLGRLALPAAMLASVLVLVEAVARAGFVPTALAFTGLWAAVLAREEAGPHRARRLLIAVLAALAAAALLLFAFGRLVGVPFP